MKDNIKAIKKTLLENLIKQMDQGIAGSLKPQQEEESVTLIVAEPTEETEYDEEKDENTLEDEDELKKKLLRLFESE